MTIDGSLNQLTAADLTSLGASYITPELAVAAQIRRVDTVEGAEIVGRKPTASKDYAGLVFPYFWPGNPHPREYRLRRDNPDLEQKPDGSIREKEKYLGPRQSVNRFYIPRDTPAEWLTDTGIPVTITEGEKKTLALWRLYQERGEDQLVIGLSGVWNWRGVVGKAANGNGKRQDVSGTISDLDRIAWQDREVLIVFDANVLTDESVTAARRELSRELQRREAVPIWVNLPTGVEDVNGIDDLLARCGPDFVAELLVDSAQAADLSSHTSHISQPHWPEYPEGAFYGLAGRMVEAIEPHTEADPVALLVQFLVSFGSLVGRSAYFVAEADKHFCNLNTVIVGNTSKGRKGTSWGQIKSVLGSTDKDWLFKCVSSGLSSGEGLIWAVRDPIEKREAVKEKGRIVDYQDVVTDQGVSDKRLLVVEPEFALVLKTAAREGNTLSAIIRQAWDDGNLKSLTKNSPARATEAHISIIGHVTKDELRRHLEDTETANGFANRFLWICARQSKLLPEGGRLDQVNFSKILADIQNAAQHASKTTEMRRNEDARRLWFDVYPELADAKPGLLGAVTGRAEAQVMRLATIYALLDCEQMIGRRHLEAALALWKYCEDSARYIFGEAMGDPIADTILASLKEVGVTGMTRTEIRDLFKRHATSSQIDRALESLANAGRAESRKQVTGGRPTERWFARTLTARKATKATKAPESGPGDDLLSHMSHMSQQENGKIDDNAEDF
jgi:hypothetical protein